MKKFKLVIIFLAFLIIIVFIESQTRILHRLYDNFYDNENHYLPCSELPTEEFVKQVLTAHKDTVEAILDVNPGAVGFEVDTNTCPEKADLIIWYASHQNRLSIQKILNESDFYGVPLRLQNR